MSLRFFMNWFTFKNIIFLFILKSILELQRDGERQGEIH